MAAQDSYTWVILISSSKLSYEYPEGNIMEKHIAQITAQTSCYFRPTHDIRVHYSNTNHSIAAKVPYQILIRLGLIIIILYCLDFLFEQ